jgi:hypothetical protein
MTTTKHVVSFMILFDFIVVAFVDNLTFKNIGNRPGVVEPLSWGTGGKSLLGAKAPAAVEI